MDRKRQGKSLACVKWRSSIIRNSSAGVSLSCPGWIGRTTPCFQKVCLHPDCTYKVLTLSRKESIQCPWKFRPRESGNHSCSKYNTAIHPSRASLSVFSLTSCPLAKTKTRKVMYLGGVSFVSLDGSSGCLPPGRSFQNAILQQ